MILKIEKKQIEPDVVVLEMAGRMVLGSDSQQVEWQLRDLIQANAKKVIFDLTQTDSMDSTGIGIIAMCAMKMKKAGGELRVAGANAHIAETLHMTQIDRVVKMFPTASEAAQGFGAAPAKA